MIGTARTDAIGQVAIELTANTSAFNRQVKDTLSTTKSSFSSTMNAVKSVVSSAFSGKEVISYSKQIDYLQFKLDDLKATLTIANDKKGLFGTTEIKEMEAEAEQLENQLIRLKELSSDGSIKNNFKQLGDTFKSAFDGSRADEISNKLKQVGTTGVNAIKNMASQGDGFTSKIAGSLLPTISKIAPAFSKAIPVIGQIIAIIEVVAKVIETIINLGKKLFQTVQKIDDFMDKVLDKIKEYGKKFKDLISNVAAGYQKVSGFIKNLTGQSTKFENSWSTSLRKIGTLFISVFGISKLISFGKQSVETASQTYDAWVGLNSIVSGQGKSFKEAQGYIEDYVSDGLVPLQNAVNAYKNLTAAGYTEEQTQQIMERLKDASAFGRQSHLTLGEAVQTATEGIKNQNSVLVDNAGVTKNLSVMYEEYAKSIGKTTAQLTDEEKRLATVNGIMKETQFQVGDAAKLTDTYSGKVAKLSAAFTNLKNSVGRVLIPILNAIIPTLQRVIEALTKFFNRVSEILNKIGLKMPKIADSAGSAISGVGDSADSTSDSIAGTGDAAAAAAKKINKAFSKIDEINVLNSNNDTSSGGSGGSGSGSGSDLGNLDTDTVFEEVQDTSSTLLDNVKKTAFEMGAILAQGLNEGMASIDWDPIKAKAKKIATNIGNFINGFVYELDWDLVGHTIAEGINTALIFANTLLTTIDFKRIGQSFATGLNAMIRDIDWKLLGETIANYFNMSLDYLTGFLTTFSYKQLGEKLAIGMNSLVNTVHWDNISTILVNGINGVFTTMFEFVSNFEWSDLGKKIYEQLIKTINGIEWDKIGITLGELFNGAIDLLSETIGKKELWKSLGDSLVSGFNNFISTIDWKEAGTTVSNFVTGITGLIKNLLKNVEWKQAFEEFLDGVDIAQILVDILTIKFELKKMKWQAVGKIVVDGIIDGIKLYFKTRFENIGNYLDEWFVQPWKEAFDTKDKEWYEIGADIIKGIFKGIAGILMFPLKLVKEFIFDPIIAGIKAVFGIASPAKEMELYGEYIIQGLLNGFTNLKQKALEKWAEVKTWFGEIKGKVSATFTTTKKTVEGWVSNVKSWWGTVKTKVSTSYSTTKTNVSKWWDNVKSWWGTKKVKVASSYSTTKKQVSGWWTTIKNWWSTKKLSIGSTNTTTKSQVSKWWSNIKSWWGNRTLSLKADIGAVSGNVKSWFNDNLIKPLNSKLPKFIPKIPYLAQGSWFAKNSPQLAVVGDNKREPEIVSPESKIKEQVIKGIEEMGGTTQNQHFDFTIKLEYPDGKYLIKEINDTQIKDGKISLLI